MYEYYIIMYEYYNGEPVSKFNSSKYSFKFVNQQHFFLLQLVLYEAYNNHCHLVPHQNGDEQRIGFSTYMYFLFDQNVAVSRENIYIYCQGSHVRINWMILKNYG